MIVMSGRCVPPAIGWFVIRTSPSLRFPAHTFTWWRTASCMEPRWTGMCGAFATRPPLSSNSAHEKSRRSLMLVEIDVRWRVRPICSAIDMKRCWNIDSCTASTWVDKTVASSAWTVIRTSPLDVISATHPGSTRTVEIASSSIAGPSTFHPGPTSESRKTSVSRRPPSKYTAVVATAAGAATSIRDFAALTVLRPMARTRMSSTTISRPCSSKPNSRR
mmetsp:Transcript_42976/g.102241  ORF Transcript_42976/g.102241 Transcript_42976/m.102241 type:complete len:219 (-) Transcript_42976:1321-1977(-)